MLYGMGAEQAQLWPTGVTACGFTCPSANSIPGMAYLVRRLLENTSNDSFLRQSFTEHIASRTLLMKPADAARSQTPAQRRPPEPARQHPFNNEPPTDFSAEAAAMRCRRVAEVARQFGKNIRS